MQIVSGKATSVFSFHSLKALPRLLELPRGSARSEVMEGVGARRRLTTELCQSWAPVGRTPPEQTCLAKCWAGDRARLKLNILTFNPDASSQMGE